MLVLALAVLTLLIAAAVIAYPLVFASLESYLVSDLPDEEFRESDALLEALSELEQSKLSGKLSEQDYRKEKLRLQKEYIESAEAPAKAGGKRQQGNGGKNTKKRRAG